LKSQRGTKETFLINISEFSPKNILWYPLFEIFYRKIFPGRGYNLPAPPCETLVRSDKFVENLKFQFFALEGIALENTRKILFLL
jgi:hypothetical protein